MSPFHHDSMVAEPVSEIPANNLDLLCRYSELDPDWGEAIWHPDGQMAIFRTPWNDLHLTTQRCPSTGANVMARGILGDATIDGQRVETIACPLHKEVYRLDTGANLAGTGASLAVYDVRVVGDWLYLGPRR
ncbi:nitrite reductase (NAD(P)H) small subunit [Glutamicibacter sp. PS]|uniref:nitrite reductase (NAD(P)H) small subunit n=1 Tax=Glutamicibacter sp. PS TaxID=3075634 RepID=UPI0028464077|nr:nitrite reductase (NAD(P)H) small subunit [Glutamicibacter sp. PS]MDR4534750.1 nitrite reductase (NAD(P)H) small subunit [Glutamicibacter sp. PS]